MTDRNFVKTFSGLVAALAALTVVIFILAQMVVSASNLKKDKTLAQNDAAVAERIKPVGEVAVSSNKVMDALIPTKARRLMTPPVACATAPASPVRRS
jgi:hypothetical protein